MRKVTKKPYWLNKKSVIAGLDGVSTSTFDKWQIEPAAKIGRETFFALQDILENFLDRKTMKLRQENEKLRQKILELENTLGAGARVTSEVKRDKDIAHTRLLEGQSIAQELKNKVTMREMAPFGYITYILAGISNEIRGFHDTLPMECGKQLGLSITEIETISIMVSNVAERIAKLGDKRWLEKMLVEYEKQNRG